jgi:basic membrane lipoprotein Med (substrate-binding protein (PBP1-ABC) superfamily)
MARVANSLMNPFKGLNAFGEADVEDYFGRERLVAEVLARLGRGRSLVALVGPSGSGKSSVVYAGVIPTLRKGALPGSDHWLIASMTPSSYPFVELEAALLRATVDPPASLAEQFAERETGLLRAALRVLPDSEARLVLVIDQFEELFTLVDDADVRQRFLANLVTVIDDPHGRVMVVLTMRADAYHHPLAHPEFGTRLGTAVVNVVPLAPDELEAAAEEPAARRGVALEPGLLAELLSDVVGEPGALPIFEYTLTELFDRRSGNVLTAHAYRSMGGVRGALSRQADAAYAQLTDEQQAAAQQLFLRLVTITEHGEWSRRRVQASEIVSLDVDVVAMEAVVDQFGRHRFLAFDRDHSSGTPTVEVAHEALLWEWDRLRDWIEQSRHDVDRHTTLLAAINEWQQAGCNADYLLAGARLAEYERWSAATSMKLTAAEHEYLDAALEHRQTAQTGEAVRLAYESRLRRRARRRLWGLIAAALVLVGITAGILVVTHHGHRRTVAIVFSGANAVGIDALEAEGLGRAQREFGFHALQVTPPTSDLEGELRHLGQTGTDLVIVADTWPIPTAKAVAPSFPHTTWAYLDATIAGSVSTRFADEQSAFLVGSAAALTSHSGTIGFVGGFQTDNLERFRAGYEAGARAANPGVKILARYAAFGYDGYTREDYARALAVQMYRQGADVVFAAAGTAGLGVVHAAHDESAVEGKHLWAIGADSDEYYDVDATLRPYVLSSTLKKYEVAVYSIIKNFLNGRLKPASNTFLTLADGTVDFSTSGGFLDGNALAFVDRMKQDISAGLRTVPIAPTGSLDPPWQADRSTPVTVTFDGSTCRYDGPGTLKAGEVLAVSFINKTRGYALVTISDPGRTSVAVQVPASANSKNRGYASATFVAEQISCVAGVGTGAETRGPTLPVG